MDKRPLTNIVGMVLVTVAVTAGLAWRDCMLLAICVVLGHRLFLLRMDLGAPWPTLTATVDVLSAAVAFAAAGLALIFGVAFAWWGWWQPSEPHLLPTLALLAIAATSYCMAKDEVSWVAEAAKPWLWLAGGVILATWLHQRGLRVAPCLLVSGVGFLTLRTSWRLARGTAMDMLESERHLPL